MPKRLVITNGRILGPDGPLDALHLEGDRIAPAGHPDAEPLDARGAWVVPGLIDTHVHGGLEHDTMDGTDQALMALGAHLARHGVTAWTPTTVACEAPRLDQVLARIEAWVEKPGPGARVLGAHLESSFINPLYKGAQPEACLRPIEDAAWRSVLTRRARAIRLLTLAPELPGALDLIAELKSLGIVVAVGHTDATYEQVIEAIRAGASRVTHLCNAQRGLHHREPGVVGAGLDRPELACEVIADGQHLHPALLRIAHRCKGAEGLILISDALRGAGLPPGRHELGGQITILDGTVARLESGTIAGSIITLDRAIARAVEAGIPAEEAFRMASLTPARTLGLGDRGLLAPGFRADLALLDDNFRCVATMVSGDWVYRAP